LPMTIKTWWRTPNLGRLILVTIPHRFDSGFSIFRKCWRDHKPKVKWVFAKQCHCFENRLQEGTNRSVLGIGNIKLDYSPSAKKMVLQTDNTSRVITISNTINSITNVNASILKHSTKPIIRHKTIHRVAQSYNLKHHHFSNQSSIRLQHATNQLVYWSAFLSRIILQEDSIPHWTSKKSKTNSVDALFKHYWL
jgi:hypothetical protein